MGASPVATTYSLPLDSGSWAVNIRVVGAGADELEEYAVGQGGLSLSTKLGSPAAGLRVDFMPAAGVDGSPQAQFTAPEVVTSGQPPVLTGTPVIEQAPASGPASAENSQESRSSLPSAPASE